MSPSQQSLYWRLWTAAKIAQGWNRLPAADQDEKRHQAHAQALGRDKSSTLLNNRDLDSIFATFKALANPDHVAVAEEDARAAALRAGDRRRLIYRIGMILPAAYANKIALDKFGHTDLGRLTVDQLTQLRDTLVARKQALRRRADIDAVTQPVAAAVPAADVSTSENPF